MELVQHDTDEAMPLSYARPARRRRRDDGSTFVELLVAIVLLGTVVVATLAGLRATIIGTSVDRDQANAHAWLQSATDLIYGSPRQDCGAPTDTPAQRATKKAAVIAAYQAIASGVPNPEGWPASNITVSDVQYWDGDLYQDICYDDFRIALQLVTVVVRNTDGKIVEDVQVVKGE